jgi:hypothetical protein
MPANHPSNRAESNGFCSRVSINTGGLGVPSCFPPRSANTGTAGCVTGAAPRVPPEWKFNQSRGPPLYCILMPLVPTHIRGGVLQGQVEPTPQCWLQLRNSCIREAVLCFVHGREFPVRSRRAASGIVVQNPLPQHSTEVSLVERNRKIHPFAAHGPNQPFTKCTKRREFSPGSASRNCRSVLSALG